MPSGSNTCIVNNAIRHKYGLGPEPLLCFCAALVLCCYGLCRGQDVPEGDLKTDIGLLQSQPGELFSPTVGRKFFNIAYELANIEPAGAGSSGKSEQAITFLAATTRLDSTAEYVVPELVRLISTGSKKDYSRLMFQLLTGYVDQSADIEVVRQGISYLAKDLNSREQRESLLRELLKAISGRNRVVESELATELGLLTAQIADVNTAQSYFLSAYNNNKYNKVAFAKLAELFGSQVKPSLYLEHYRLALGENPLDMDAALLFAQYAERLELFQPAAEAYEYCAELFKFLYPSEPLPGTVYFPWAISSYNTRRGQTQCLQIASEVRQSGHFNLLLEAIAGRAAMKIGDKRRAEQILKDAEARALELVAQKQPLNKTGSQSMDYQQLAWFYCFAEPDPNQSVEWANKAYSCEPNSASAAAILAYSLVMNGQTDWPRLLIENYDRSQIAELALARIQLAEGKTGSAVETLKTAISRDPSSLAAERAKQILAEQGGHYIPPIDPEIILTALKGKFGRSIVPKFRSPEKLFSLQLKLRGNNFSYGSSFEGRIAITNKSDEPLIISDDGLIKGWIRIDADISGDIDKEIPKLVSMKVQPALPVEPGGTFFVPVQLYTGRLREVLFKHPQASVKIEFTVYLDPVVGEQGEPANRLATVEPARTLVERSAVALSSRYLQNRLDTLKQGRQAQKIKSARLFAGLLAEQKLMADREQPYRLLYAEWMPDLLESALQHNLADDDWVIKVHTMTEMLDLSPDYELTEAVAKSLNDDRWPCRLMAVFLLAKSQGSDFQKVLDWTAKNDSNSLVRQMAVALGGEEPHTSSASPPENADSLAR